jgi:chromosome segregation ATPase
MDTYLTNLEAEIAEVEREIAALPRTNAKMGKRHKAVAETRKALEAKHEDLVMRVQQTTVGAASPGQVL